jgi:hypothetical protein
MQRETVNWFVNQKHTYPSMGRLHGDYDVLAVISQKPETMLLLTLINKVVDGDKTLTIDAAKKINSFHPVMKGVVVEPDEVLPSVISLENLTDVCEKIVSFPSNNDRECFSMKYAVITVAKAYLQTIGRYERLTRFQFEFTSAELVADGFVVCPHGRISYLVTFYGIIGYLLGDNDWMNTYLESPTATFASDEDPDVHTHLADDREEKWIIGNRSELLRRRRYISPYSSPYGDDDSISDDSDDYHDDYLDYF